jgi:hypothetical protein
MARGFLNGVSDWALGAIFLGAAIVVALAGWALLRRAAPGWRDLQASEVVVGVAAMAMTLFAVVLAFVVVTLYGGYQSAVSAVGAEASALGGIVRDAQAFPASDRRRINTAVTGYAAEVRAREFALMRNGREDPEARRLLNDLFEMMQRYSPVTETERTFYGLASDRLSTVADERQKRLQAAETAIPGPLAALILITALVTLATTLLLKTHHPAADIALVVSVAVMIAAGLVTALILEYPFSGSIAVPSTPFGHVSAGG